MNRAATQRTFLNYLLAEPTNRAGLLPSAELQALLTDANPHGLAIYRNAYTARLIGVLKSDHEKLWGLAGEASCEAMARNYIEAHPSRVRSLRHFGAQLPAFLRQQETPHAELLAELCGFERLLLDVYDAPDATPIEFADIAAIEPAHWPALALRFHPSLRLFDAPCGAIGYWQELHAGHVIEPNALPPPTATMWRLWRNRERVSQFQPLDEAQRVALIGFQAAGANLAQVAETLLEEFESADIVGNINQWLRDWCAQGLVIGVSLNNGISPLPG